MSEPTQEVVTLTTLAGGAAVELFQNELDRVLRNIADPNTDAKGVRKIQLTIAIKPNEDRDMGAVTISATSKMASVKPAPTVIYMGEHRGQPVAVETNPKQISMFQEKAPGRPVPVSPSK
jgi:hypothetical protein